MRRSVWLGCTPSWVATRPAGTRERMASAQSWISSAAAAEMIWAPMSRSVSWSKISLK